MEKFWDSDEAGSDAEEFLRVDATSEEMELEVGKTMPVRRKEDWSLAKRLERKEKKKAEKRMRANKKKEAETEEELMIDEAGGSNVVEETICKKKRKIKRKKVSWGLPELKLMRVDEVEESTEGEKEVKDEIAETEGKMEGEEIEEQMENEKAEEGKRLKEEVKKEMDDGEEKVEEAKMEVDEDEDGMREIMTKREARKEARKWCRVLDGVRDMLDIFEDGGMEKEKVRKCRRDIEGVKGGLLGLSEAKVWSEKCEGIVSDETEKVVKRDGEKMKIKMEKLDEKAEGGVRKVKKEMIPMVVENWVSGWSSIGKEDVRIQVFDCEERWTEREVRDGLWESVFKKERYLKEDMKQLRTVWRRRERGQQIVTFVYAMPFKRLVVLMERADKTIKINGQEKSYEVYVEVKVCWVCQNYGHSKESCDVGERCRGCGGGHHVRECTRRTTKCVTCEEEGLDERGHRANSVQCVLHRALLHKKREKMECLIKAYKEGKYDGLGGVGRGRKAEFDRVVGKPGKR